MFDIRLKAKWKYLTFDGIWAIWGTKPVYEDEFWVAEDDNFEELFESNVFLMKYPEFSDDYSKNIWEINDETG